MDQEVVDTGGVTSSDRMSYFGDGLQVGQCGLKVESIAENDVGSWSCTLISTSGIILNGVVNLMNRKLPVQNCCVWFVLSVQST